jgi:hypothetical protein
MGDLQDVETLIHERLKALLAKKGISRRQLAERIKIKESYLGGLPLADAGKASDYWNSWLPWRRDQLVSDPEIMPSSIGGVSLP